MAKSIVCRGGWDLPPCNGCYGMPFHFSQADAWVLRLGQVLLGSVLGWHHKGHHKPALRERIISFVSMSDLPVLTACRINHA